MGEERLCGLVIFHVHRDMNVSRENILRRFDETGYRKIGTLHFECIALCRTIVLNLF